jgi:hypothetical protein
MARLILQRMSNGGGLVHQCQSYWIRAWVPPPVVNRSSHNGRGHITLKEKWHIEIFGYGFTPGVCSGSDGTGEIRMPCTVLPEDNPDKPRPTIGVLINNRQFLEEAVLDFNLKFGNNTGLTLEDVIWEAV